jgi:ribonuclease D
MGNEGVLKVFHAARRDIEIVCISPPFSDLDTQVAAKGARLWRQHRLRRQLVSASPATGQTHRFTDSAPAASESRRITQSPASLICDVFAALDADLKQQRGRAIGSARDGGLTSPRTCISRRAGLGRLKTGAQAEGVVLMEVRPGANRKRRGATCPLARSEGRCGQRYRDHAPTSPGGSPICARCRKVSTAQMGRRYHRRRAARHCPRSVNATEDQPRGNSNGAAIVELLKVLLRMTSERHAVASKVIATVDDLEQIAADDSADVAALHGWRRELFGEAALSLKHGRLALAIEKGRVVRVDRDKAV